MEKKRSLKDNTMFKNVTLTCDVYVNIPIAVYKLAFMHSRHLLP